jgi:hypothetical protein
MAFQNLLNFIIKIVFSLRQALVALIMLGALFSVILFYLFFKTFESYYIDELKAIYPTLYVATSKKVDPNLVHDVVALPEIFELDWSDFVLSFDDGESYSLGSVGMRSFHKHYMPKILQNVYEDEGSIYVSSSLYELLQSQKGFDGRVTIESDVDNTLHTFHVKEFVLHDDIKWVLMEDVSAKTLYRSSSFDKVVFYSDMEDELLYETLDPHFTQPLFTWDEHISLSSRALKESMVYVFSLLSIAIVILVMASFFFFAQTILDDLAHITRFAFFYGISRLQVFWIYFVLINLYFFIIYFLAYFLSAGVNSTLVETIWQIEAKNSISFLTLIGWVELCIVLSLGVYIYLSHKVSGERMGRGH